MGTRIRIGRRINISPLWVAIAIIVLIAAPALYLAAKTWQTSRAIYHEIPTQAQGALTPAPTGRIPIVIITPQATATRGVASQLTPYDPSKWVPSPTAEVTPVVQSNIKEWNGKKRINFLLLGVDRRGNEIPRSDTIILASLDFEHNRAYVLSIPRDLYVNVPGFNYWKINAAYALGENPKYKDQVGGGIGLLIMTLRQNFGIDIDEYATIDFEGFIKGIDAIGGVDIRVPKKIVDNQYPSESGGYERVVFNAGLQHMDGEMALKYARTRHADSDFGRMRRQQQIILAVQQKAKNPSILLKAPTLLNIIKGHVETSLSPSEQLKLGRWAASLPKKNIEFYSIEGPIGMTPDGQSVVYADWNAINPILKKVFGPQAGHP